MRCEKVITDSWNFPTIFYSTYTGKPVLMCLSSLYRIYITDYEGDYISRVSDQNGVSLLCIMLEIHHSGREPSISSMPRRNFILSTLTLNLVRHSDAHLWHVHELLETTPSRWSLRSYFDGSRTLLSWKQCLYTLPEFPSLFSLNNHTLQRWYKELLNNFCRGFFASKFKITIAIGNSDCNAAFRGFPTRMVYLKHNI